MKNNFSRAVNVFFSSLFIFTLHLPFVFANTKPLVKNEVLASPVTGITTASMNSIDVMDTYDRLQLNELGLSEAAFSYAVKGYDRLKEQGRLNNDEVISIVDFTKSSSQKRLFILDIKNFKVLFNTYVAHGQGSGQEFANKFSNMPESLQSSLGFFLTSDTYIGKHGYSMHLEGVESGINDKANERSIVLHGAPYVSEDFIKSRGYIGRSWGCPAVPEKLTRPIIEKIKNGSCLFIYSENKGYLNRSKLLNS